MKLPKGFLLSGIHCGIKRKHQDLGLIYAPDFCAVSGVFTVNANPAYSVTFSKENIGNSIKAVLVNSGNANCYSHKNGLEDTKDIASGLAKALKVKQSNVLFLSTGLIGKKLPKDRIKSHFPSLIKHLGEKSDDFARSILTTDTFDKQVYVRIPAKQRLVSIAGFAKGAGMVYPNMATMLSFILTDVRLPKGVLGKIFKEAVEESFNSISIDGCMSTNDTALLLSSGKVSLGSKKELKLFSKRLKDICLDLAKMIVRDAEGATKFVEIQIKGARSKQEAKKAGMCLANSNLFKCALYGENANWGRIISSLGQAGIGVKENIRIIASSLSKKNVTISIDLKRGKYSGRVYTSDLTSQYGKINAEYS